MTHGHDREQVFFRPIHWYSTLNVPEGSKESVIVKQNKQTKKSMQQIKYK